MKKNFLLKNHDIVIFCKVFDTFNKYLGISLNTNDPYPIIFYGFRIFCIIAHFWHLIDTYRTSQTPDSFFRQVLHTHYYVIVAISITFQISSFFNRKNFYELSKYFRNLQNDHGVYLDWKKLAEIYLSNFFYVIFVLFSACLRTFFRKFFWDFNSFWNVFKTLSFLISGILGLFIQHYLILLFCNCLIILRMHIKLLNYKWKSIPDTNLIKLVRESDVDKTFG